MRRLSVLILMLALAACSSSGSVNTARSSTGGSSGGTGTTGASVDAGPLAAQLMARVQQCNQVSHGLYKIHDVPSVPPTIPICSLPGAFFWTSSMNVDCDGKTTAQCNLQTDPSYQDQTSLTDSHGAPLDAAVLPYVVIPLPSSIFNAPDAGIELGSVVAVLYKGQLNFGVYGDEGPPNIIGEASYAMANSLGIDPDPATGGVESGVTYIVFTGSAAVPAVPEDHAAAVQLGEQLAAQLVRQP
jgi:hypothetical protein